MPQTLCFARVYGAEGLTLRFARVYGAEGLTLRFARVFGAEGLTLCFTASPEDSAWARRQGLGGKG